MVLYLVLRSRFAHPHEGGAAEQLEKLIEMKGHRATLGEMARELHHSPSWIRTRFKEAIGVTPRAAKQAQTLHLAKYYIQ